MKEGYYCDWNKGVIKKNLDNEFANMLWIFHGCKRTDKYSFTYKTFSFKNLKTDTEDVNLTGGKHWFSYINVYETQ